MYDEKAIKAAMDRGEGEDLLLKIKPWEQVGDFLVGELESVHDFESSEFDTPCKRYVLRTNGGRISTVLGAVVDKSLQGQNLIDKTLYIEYKGKIPTKGGRHMNDFVVRRLTNAENYQRVGKEEAETGKK